MHERALCEQVYKTGFNYEIGNEIRSGDVKQSIGKNCYQNWKSNRQERQEQMEEDVVLKK